MRRLLYALLIGLFGAGIVHIVILFLVPEFSDRNAWSRLGMVSDLNVVTSLDTRLDGGPVVRGADPLFRSVACRFDLSDGTLQVKAPGTAPFWSVSVYNRGGQNIYSFNDRTAEKGRIDFVVLTPEQMVDARKYLPEDFQKSIFVETPIGEGIVVLRVFVPDASWTKAVDELLAGMSCAAR